MNQRTAALSQATRLALCALSLFSAIACKTTGAAPDAAKHSHARGSVSETPRLSVCWIEFGNYAAWAPLGTAGATEAERFDVTFSASVIRHPKGDVLLDSGYSSRALEEIESLPLLARTWVGTSFKKIKSFTPADKALRAAGLDATRFKWFIPSHAHNDHVGGLVDLPAQAVLLPEQEKSFIEGPNAAEFHIPPAHVAVMKGRMTAMPFKPAPYEIFDESFDLFGDGSVVIIRMGGHTPGSIAAFINLSPERRLVHIGDLVSTVESIQRQVPKSRFVQFFTDHDAEETARQVGRLAHLRRERPELLFLPAHDRAAWVRAFDGGPRCIDGGRTP